VCGFAVARQNCALVRKAEFLAIFTSCIFSQPHAAHFRIQTCIGTLRIGEEKRKKKEEER